MTNTATPKQISYIQALQAERLWREYSRDAEDNEEYAKQDPKGFAAGVVISVARDLWYQGKFCKKMASTVIDHLQRCDRKTVEGEPTPWSTPIVAAGRYAITGNDESTDFYRVTKRGRVLLVVSDSEQTVSPSHASSVLRKIAEDPKTASLRYGREIGCCGVCGRTLTDETSRARGIGPVCAEKFGW